MKNLGKILGYLLDRIFTCILMGVALMGAVLWLVAEGHFDFLAK